MGRHQREEIGSRATYIEGRIHRTWGYLQLGLQGEERVGTLRFLNSTADRVTLITEQRES